MDQNAIRFLEDEVLAQASLVGAKIGIIAAEYPSEADRLRQRVSKIIDDGFKKFRGDGRPRLRAVAAEDNRELDLEANILEFLGQSDVAVSADDVFEFVRSAINANIKKPTLMVRLHRMAAAGKILNTSHGYYESNKAA